MRSSLPTLPRAIEHVRSLSCMVQERGTHSLEWTLTPLATAIETAQTHNVLGVILPAIRRKHGSLLAPLEETLTTAEVALGAQALFREDELRAVLEIFEAARLEVVVLKGAFLAPCLYGDFAERLMNDFDLFVRRADLPRAAAILHEAGYTCEEEWPYQEARGGALHFRNSNGQAIEVRFDLTQGRRLRGVFCFPEEEMWQRRRTFNALSVGRLCSLDPTDHLIYLVYHAGILHLFAALIWFVDVDRFVRKFHNEIGWESLFTRARQIGCATCLWYGLGLAKQLLETPVDDSVLLALQPSTHRASVIQRWLTPRNLLRGMKPPKLPRMLLIQTLLMDTLGASARSFHQGVFPPSR